MTGANTIDISAAFADMTVGERLAWACDAFPGQLVATTSFGIQSVVLLHLLRRHAPHVPILCVDTGYLFAETYRYAQKIEESLGIEVAFHTSAISPARMEAVHGRLWEMGEDARRDYAKIRKIEPLDRAIRDHGARAWISGLRRSQSEYRATRPFLERQNKLLKIYPILDWTDKQVHHYFQEHDLPVHPLAHRGFVSIGDWHSSRPLSSGMRAEDTRQGIAGRECGIHLDSGSNDFQI